MATTTDYLKLHKPDMVDPADITKLNPNWDTLDNYGKKLDNHTINFDNPHNVTAEQLGIDLSAFEAHLRDKANPHQVTKSQVGLSEVPNKATHFATYYSFAQIDIVNGEETIESIATKLPKCSELTVLTGLSNNLEIYPKVNGESLLGILRVIRSDSNDVQFQYWCLSGNVPHLFVGMYEKVTSAKWSGWQHLALGEYLPLTGGTLTGELRIEDYLYLVNHPLKITNGVTTTEITGLVNPVAEGHHFLDINLFGQYASGTLRMSVEDGGKLVTPNDMLQMKMAEVNGGIYWYKVYHEGNKPHGSYSGTNTVKSVGVGGKGVGRAVLIWTEGFVTLITPEGGFTMGTKNTINDGSYDKNEVRYDYNNGELIINRTYSSATEPDRLAGINKSGVTYSYQVI